MVDIYNLPKKANVNDFIQTDKCPDCGSTNLTHDSARAEISCPHCGRVIEENIVDQGPSRVAYNQEQRDARVNYGAPVNLLYSDKGLSTNMGNSNADLRGVPKENLAQVRRMRNLNKRNRISRAGERNLAIAFSEISRESSKLGIPRMVREEAALIYRKAAKMNLVRGRSIDGVASTSIYIACRACNLPRTLDEISEVSKVTKQEIGRTYRFLVRQLGIKLKPTSPVTLIPRFASQLSLSGEVESKTIDIIRLAIDGGLNNGKTPTAIAAGALYIAALLLGEKKTQRSIAQVAKVSEVTIRNTYKEFSENLDLGVSL
jgi:transcription initiation factor TFIIB